MIFYRAITIGSIFLVLGCGTGEQTYNSRGEVAGKYDPEANAGKQLPIKAAEASTKPKTNIRVSLPIKVEEDQAKTRENRIKTNIIAEISDPEAGTNILATQTDGSELGLTLKGPSGGSSTVHKPGPVAEFEIEFTDEDGYYELTVEPFQNFSLPKPIVLLVDRSGPQIVGTGEFKTLIGEDLEESYFLSAEFNITDIDSARCVLRDPNKNELPAEFVDGQQGDKSFSMVLSNYEILDPIDFVRLDCIDPAGNINAYQLTR